MSFLCFPIKKYEKIDYYVKRILTHDPIQNYATNNRPKLLTHIESLPKLKIVTKCSNLRLF